MKTEETVFRFGNREIAYNLHRRDRRNVRIVVNPDLVVDVHAPKNLSTKKLEGILAKKAAWICRKLDRMTSYHPLPEPKKYISGETFVYLGRQYRLKVVNGDHGTARLLGPFLNVSVGNREDTARVRKLVDCWYREHAQEIFGRYLEQCIAIASRHGVPNNPPLRIRKMRTRWGSCTSAGRITLNLHLVKTPVHCIEYVIMHELCHLRHPNHSPAFYSLLSRCQPDWEIRKKTLDRLTVV